MDEPTRSAETAAKDSARRIARVALWLALAVALVSRAAYLDAKPFWRDEAWVALLVGHPKVAITDGRPVPIGFLLLTDAAATALPTLSPEVTFRLVPLLCGLAVLPLLAWLGVELGAGALTAVAAVWLGVGLTPLIYYSRELKPYGIDLLMAVLVPFCAVRGFRTDAPDRASRSALLACLAIAPWVSFGALFPILAVLSWGWLTWWRHADRAARRAWLVANLVFATSFAAAYVVIVSRQSTSPRLHDFWRTLLFAESGLSWPQRVVVATHTYFSVSLQYFFIMQWRVFLVLAVIGALTWPKPYRGFLVWFYLATAAFAVSLAVFDRYLLGHGRLLLFSAPPLLLWIANGLVYLGRRLRVPAPSHVALVICIVLGTHWAASTIRPRVERYPVVLFRYDVLQDVDAIIAQAATVVPPDDPVLISAYAAEAFEFYAHHRLPQAEYCQRWCDRFGVMTTRWLGRIRERGWMIVTDEESGLGAVVDGQGFTHRTRRRARGVALWEVTPRRAPAATL